MVNFSARTMLAIALLMPPLAWISFEYGLAISLSSACVAVGSWLGPLWGAGAFFACLIGAIIAQRTIQLGRAQQKELNRWLGKVALLGCGVFSLAILFQTIATLIVPPCVN
jgi:hypothetical protein